MRSGLARARALVVLMVAAASIAVAACGSSEEKPSAAEGSKAAAGDPEIAKLVPEEIRSKGTLVVATDATYPPFESVKNGEIVGFDPDMAQAIGRTLGLEVELVNASFDTLIPSLAAGKFDIAMSSLGDTKEREQTVDFVTYYWNSTNALVPEGNPKGLATDKLCGAQIGVGRASLQKTTMLPKLSEECAEAGQPAIRPVVFKGSSEAVLALSSGRIDGVLADAISQDDVAANSGGRLETVGPLIRNDNPGGVAIPKDSGMAEPIHAAVTKLIEDGTYEEIIARWKLEAIAIEESVINGAVN